jgi:hypothetical protein
MALDPAGWPAAQTDLFLTTPGTSATSGALWKLAAANYSTSGERATGVEPATSSLGSAFAIPSKIRAVARFHRLTCGVSPAVTPNALPNGHRTATNIELPNRLVKMRRG